MKKILSAALAVAMMLAVSACGSNTARVEAPTSPSVSTPVAETYIELTEDLGAEEYGVGFRKGDIAFGLEVQRIFDEMLVDGAAGAISTEWFGSDVLFRDKAFLKETTAPADDKSLEAIKAKGKFVVGLTTATRLWASAMIRTKSSALISTLLRKLPSAFPPSIIPC